MTSLKLLDEKSADIELTLDRVEEVLKTFDKRYDKKKDVEMKKVGKLKEDHRTTSFVAAKVEKEISAPRAAEATKTKERIKKF